MTQLEEKRQKVKALPDIFYKYYLGDDGKMLEIPVKKEEYKGSYVIFRYEMPDSKGIMRPGELARPDSIEFGVFDGKRRCVFFKESNKKREAALIFDKEDENQIAKYETKIRKVIFKRRDLARCINSGGESNGNGV